MNTTYSEDEFINGFEKRFADTHILHFEVPMAGNKIHAFFFYSIKVSDLESQWQYMSNYIALNFQRKCDSDFERGNIYLFYSTKDSISNDLKYKIENDPYSSRKLVIGSPFDPEELIYNHILNLNLGFDGEKAVVDVTDFIPDAILNEIVQDKELRKVRKTQESKTAFQELVIRLKKGER